MTEGSGCWPTGCIGGAYRRLAIIDLSRVGNQAMLDECGTVAWRSMPLYRDVGHAKGGAGEGRMIWHVLAGIVWR